MPRRLERQILYHDTCQHNQFGLNWSEDAVIGKIEAICDFFSDEFKIFVGCHWGCRRGLILLVNSPQPLLTPGNILWAGMPVLSYKSVSLLFKRNLKREKNSRNGLNFTLNKNNPCLLVAQPWQLRKPPRAVCIRLGWTPA